MARGGQQAALDSHWFALVCSLAAPPQRSALLDALFAPPPSPLSALPHSRLTPRRRLRMRPAEQCFNGTTTQSCRACRRRVVDGRHTCIVYRTLTSGLLAIL